MCIVCNMRGNPLETKVFDFLDAFKRSQTKIADATDLMLQVSRDAADPAVRRRYDKIHKRMVKLRRAWNQLEHDREAAL